MNRFIRIPSCYRVGGQDIDVKILSKLEDNKLGSVCVAEGIMKIAMTFNGEKQSETSKLNTFNHEWVHTILDAMGRHDLSEDEVFVSTFAGFLTEGMRSCEFKEEGNEGSED